MWKVFRIVSIILLLRLHQWRIRCSNWQHPRSPMAKYCRSTFACWKSKNNNVNNGIIHLPGKQKNINTLRCICWHIFTFQSNGKHPVRSSNDQNDWIVRDVNRHAVVPVPIHLCWMDFGMNVSLAWFWLESMYPVSVCFWRRNWCPPRWFAQDGNFLLQMAADLCYYCLPMDVPVF